jgi:hypothetical protein
VNICSFLVGGAANSKRGNGETADYAEERGGERKVGLEKAQKGARNFQREDLSQARSLSWGHWTIVRLPFSSVGSEFGGFVEDRGPTLLPDEAYRKFEPSDRLESPSS